MRRRVGTALVFVALLLAGCGGGHHPHFATPVPGHPCNPNDYYMQCVTQPPPKGLLAPAGMAFGIDFAWSCPNPSGHNFGASYLSPDRSKNWTRRCIDWWHGAGAKTILVWESSSTRALSGRGAGQADARSALAQALVLGLPGGRPIFFAIDFDATAAQASAIASYFRGVHDVLDNAGPVSFPRAVPVGAYGGYWPIKRLFDAGLIRYGWQTYAWSGGLWDRRAALEQYLNSATVDYDRAIAADYGQSPYQIPKPPPVLPVCFSHRLPAGQCAQVKAKIASQQRAAASSQRAYVVRGCPGLAQRVGWFASHVNRAPASKHAYRARALATSRAVYRRQACATFGQRSAYFAGAAKKLQAAN